MKFFFPKRLSAAEEKLSTLEPRAELAKTLEKEIDDLKDEIRSVKTTNTILADHNQLQSRIIRSRACSPVIYHHYSRPCSPVAVHVSRPCSPVYHISRSCSPYDIVVSRPVTPVCVPVYVPV